MTLSEAEELQGEGMNTADACHLLSTSHPTLCRWPGQLLSGRVIIGGVPGCAMRFVGVWIPTGWRVRV